MKKKSLGIYLHIPFCIRKCNYCDFCSFPDADGKLIEAYAEELIRRIEKFSSRYGKRYVDTVYFGGGTPTLMPPQIFGRILSVLRMSFDISPDAEITVECNPASIDKNGLAELFELGINRLSIGLQSADDGELAVLGRLHSFEDFCRTFGDAREVGFENISVDLMHSIPNQTLKSFERSLTELIALRPEHISVYGLKIEEGTAFFYNRDKLNLPDEDTDAELYMLCCDILSKNGYSQYEISNFAMQGRESRHNLKYWRLDDYIGFGVAAHSCFEGERFGNSRDIKAFLAGKDISSQKQKISDSECLSEYVMLGLRLTRGIDKREFFSLTGSDFKHTYPTTDAYIKGGFMREDENSIAFTIKGFLVSNMILSEMLTFDD